VTGFDDTPVAAALGLTSVRQPIEDTAGRVVDLLLARLDQDQDQPRAPEHVLLPSSLVVRDPDPHVFTSDPHAHAENEGVST
jgi:DNA-binding LacI/PurR family transcriptional regulator